GSSDLTGHYVAGAPDSCPDAVESEWIRYVQVNEPKSAERSVTFGEDSGRIAPERSLFGHDTTVADERVVSGCSVGAGRHGIVGRTGPYMSVTGTVGGWFGPGDDVGRAWDEAEAILLACDDLDAVMETIHGAETPVEARRALNCGFGFTGRQAALLLTLPVLSFTRSERERMHASRRARMDLLADVTGAIPVVREPTAPEPAEPDPAEPEPTVPDPAAPAPATSGWTTWEDEFDGTLDRIRSVMDEHYGVAPPSPPPPAAPPVPAAPVAASGGRAGRRSSDRSEEAGAVLDEQIGELCDA